MVRRFRSFRTFFFQADYKADKTIYCLKHAQKYASKPNNTDFTLRRTVLVDRETEDGRRKVRPVDFRDLKFRLGGLTVHDMGVFVEGASDTGPALVPVGMTATKSFWSVLEPAKLTTYTLTTR